MSIVEFQRALCDLTLNPVFAASVLRGGAACLAEYELSTLEKSRLVDVVRQPGMSVNCTLARANRFAPIADAFPLTCSLLKPRLKSLLDELWSVHNPTGYQLTGETAAFAAFLEQKLARGDVEHPYAAEVFRYECAAWELTQTLQRFMLGSTRGLPPEQSLDVRFAHDPRILVPCLERDEAPPPDLPAGDYPVRLTLRGDTMDVELVD